MKSVESTAAAMSVAPQRPHAQPHPNAEDERELKRRVIAEKKAAVRRDRRRTMFGRLLVLFVLLAVWELGSGRFLDPFFFSRPTAIIQSVFTGFAEKDLLRHVRVTVTETVLGYVIGAAAAVLLAVAIGVSERYYRILEPFLIAVNGIPRIAIAPLFIIWFGLGLTPKVIIAALMVFFIVFMNTVSGIRNINRNFVDLSLLLGANRLQLIGKVILPSAMPHILTSMKIVVPMAMTGAIVGEFISSQWGLGFYISRATAMMDITGAFAGILVLMVVLLVMNGIVTWLENRLTRWQSREQGPSGL